MKKILILLSSACILLGILLVGQKIVDSSRYKVTEAKILEAKQSEGKCRRRTGKMEPCIHLDLHLSYVDSSSGQENTATLSSDQTDLRVAPGDVIKVFVNKDNPVDVSVDVLRTGWKTPLAILSLAIMLFLMSYLIKSKE